MRADRWPTCLTLTFLLAGSAVAVLAGPVSSPAPPQEATSSEEPPPELSEAERLIRMQDTIELDEQKLEALGSGLADRQTLFQELAEEQKKTAAKLTEKKQRLEEVEAGSAEATALQAEIHELEARYERLNRHSNLTFEAEKALREQARSLEQKIEVDRRAVALVKGTAPIEPAASLGVTAAPVAAAPPAASPAFPMVPGVPAAALAPPAPAPEAPLLPETMAQIEARSEADEKALEALRADRGVVTFVERKQALAEADTAGAIPSRGGRGGSGEPRGRDRRPPEGCGLCGRGHHHGGARGRDPQGGQRGRPAERPPRFAAGEADARRGRADPHQQVGPKDCGRRLRPPAGGRAGSRARFIR